MYFHVGLDRKGSQTFNSVLKTLYNCGSPGGGGARSGVGVGVPCTPGGGGMGVPHTPPSVNM